MSLFKVENQDASFTVDEDAKVTTTGAMTVGGVLTASGVFGGTVSTYDDGDSAISVSDAMALTDGSSDSVALSLADGTEGQLIVIKCADASNNTVVTPANLSDGSTLTFDAAGEVAVLMFDGTNWQIVYNTSTLA